MVVKGSNQENAAYPSGLCAERVALFYANSTYPDQAVEAIAITAIHNGSQVENPISPCGSCRQVIAETKQRFNKKIKILLYSSSKILEISDSDTLLPLSFVMDDSEKLINIALRLFVIFRNTNINKISIGDSSVNSFILDLFF